MGYRDDRHITGIGGPEQAGVGLGYKMEPRGLAQAEYGASIQGTRPLEKKGRLARIGQFLRHLVSDV
jgi:hypothetical protein